MLDHPKLVLIQLDDLTYLLTVNILQPVLFDEVFKRFLRLSDVIIRSDGRTNSVTQLVKPYVLC